MAIQKCSTKSLQLNSVINTFIGLGKLTLSKKKSHNIHLGKSDKECQNLKVHDDEMEQSNQDDKMRWTRLVKLDPILNLEKQEDMAYSVTS